MSLVKELAAGSWWLVAGIDCLMQDELKSASLRELALWLFRLRRRVRVSGTSMLPLLRPGNEVLVDMRAYRRRPPRPGEVIVAQHPHMAGVWLVKRVEKVGKDGRFHLLGDNPDTTASSDSRSFGPVPRSHILGRVTGRFGD